LPYLIDLLSASPSPPGLDFPGSLRQVIDKTSDADDPLMEEVGYISPRAADRKDAPAGHSSSSEIVSRAIR